MFVSIVRAKVQPDKIELYETTFRKLRDTVLAHEPGIRFYELCRVPGEPCAYRVIEAYDDQAAQDLHLAADYYQKAAAIIVGCLENNAFEQEVVETI